MKIKNIFKKLGIYFLISCSLITILSIPVKAASSPVLLKNIKGTEARVTQGERFAWWSDGIAKLQVDGAISFCIEPTIIGFSGSYTSSNPPSTSIQKRLSLITYYGWDTSAKTDNDYATTQYMIWEALGATITFTGSFGSIYPTLKSTVQSKINNHYKLPSFGGVTYEINAGDTLTLEDKNNILNDYHITNNGGANVNISNNKLIIATNINTPDNFKISFQKVKNSYVGSNLIYDSGIGQNVEVFKVWDPLPDSVTIKVNKFGSFNIGKQNNEGTMIPGTTFMLSYNADMSLPIGSYTTGANGTVKIDQLLPQTVYFQEISVPANLVLDSTIKSISIIPNDVVSYTATNNIQKGRIILKKVDSITENKPQGDATLQGATYGLFAKENIVDPITGTTLISKGNKIGERTTKTDGSMDPFDNLYLGEYFVQEITPSNGYIINPEKIDVTLNYAGATESVVIKDITSKEKIIDGDFKITKVIEVDPDNSEITKPEKDAEFVVVLKKYVNQYGSVEEAYEHKDEFADKEYDLLVTDKDGEDTSKKLAYGTYVVKQTKIGDDNVSLLKETFEVNIENENQPTIKYVVSNQKFRSYLQLEKKDAETGKTVTLSNASFKIYDVDSDKYLTQRVGLIRHDTWTTDETGKIILPLKVPAGNYRLEEIKAPDGFLLNTDKIDFIMKESNVSIVDDEGEPIQIIVFSDSKPTGSTQIIKRDKDSSVTLSGVQYRLTAAKDVIDPADGSVIYKKGDPVSMDISEDGYYMTNELGEIIVEGLPLGSYTWKETKALDGYIQDNKEYTFELKQKDDIQKVYTHKEELTNQKSKVEILKADVENNTLEGAHLRLVDEYGQIVYEWISKKEPLKLESLLVDKEYTLYEDEAPDGYIISKPVKFIIKNTTKIQEIKMIDNQISAAKIDVYEKVLPGAKMQVVSKNTKNIVDHWTTTDKMHHISNLIEGQEYILQELEAPNGYVLAKDITFVANDKKEIQMISMTDNQVIVNKVDNEDKAVKGSLLQVVDKDNKAIDSWVSNDEGHAVSGLIVGNEYTLQELEAPKGYVLAKDMKFTVNDKKDIQKLTMIDKQVTALKVDEDGNVLPGATMQVVSAKTKNIVDKWTSTGKAHNVSNLIDGQEYILQELEAPDGFEIADDIKFTVDNKKDIQMLEMSDKYILTTIQVNKVDSYTKFAIRSKNFEFTAYKDKDCKDPFITVDADTKEGTASFDLRYGEWWIKETKAPIGYLLSGEIKHVVINKEGVFVNEKKIDEKDMIYSFVYYNSPVQDDVVKTGDNTNIYSFVILGVLSCFGLIIIKLKRKE